MARVGFFMVTTDSGVCLAEGATQIRLWTPSTSRLAWRTHSCVPRRHSWRRPGSR